MSGAVHAPPSDFVVASFVGPPSEDVGVSGPLPPPSSTGSWEPTAHAATSEQTDAMRTHARLVMFVPFSVRRRRNDDGVDRLHARACGIRVARRAVVAPNRDSDLARARDRVQTVVALADGLVTLLHEDVRVLVLPARADGLPARDRPRDAIERH